MAATHTFHGRLPGVDCQPALPPAAAAIRLDVTAFVGFAERGPLDTPVVVQDINQYASVFGGDLIVASDGGVPVYANLPGAVTAFFDNGGQRCYVVRVAGAEARAARWQLPGMRLWQPDGQTQDVFIQAAWPGSWSDEAGVGTQLRTTPLPASSYARAQHGQPGRLRLTPSAVRGIGVGDLVQLALGPVRPQMYACVAAVDAASGVVLTGAEVPFLSGLASPSGDAGQLLLGPDALAAIPAEVEVASAWLLRLDLIAREQGASVLERWSGQQFNPGPSWADVIQPADNPAPDLTRSMLLRADPQTQAAAATGVFVPVGMDQLGTSAEFADRQPAPPGPSGEPVTLGGSDGLSSYDPVSLFLDPNLADETVDSLLADADQLTVLAPDPLRLHGIHALIGVDDVALLSVPDTVHPGWSPAAASPPQPPPAQVPLPPPAWSSFRDCAAAPWSPPATPGPPAAGQLSSLPGLPALDLPAGYDPAALLQVHAAMAQMCAARADMLAVLAVPRHFDVPAVLSWSQALTALAHPSEAGRTVSAPLSFAGFWHPWVQVREPATPQLAPLRPQPPDGAVCGMIAARELARGAWVAAAGVPLRGPVALLPQLADADVRQLFDARANLLRQQPGAFTTISAHTLATDPVLLQVSVRRLLILLRKIALAEGARYVFDTNTDRFRQLVRMRFERILGQLASLGALAAFQVVTAGGVNTPDDIDNGRLIVQLQVAPTSPVEFITVSLVRAGESLLDVVVG